MSVSRLEQSIELPPPSGNPEFPFVRSYDAQGRLISQVPANVLLDSDRLLNSPRLGVVSGEVPYMNDIARLDLVYKDKIIATRSAAAVRPNITQPTVELPSLSGLFKNSQINNLHKFQLNIGPNITSVDPPSDFSKEAGALVYRWQDQTNAPVKYTVQISINGGKEWSTVAIETPQHSITIDPSWIEGAKTLDVRVRASDGIHETFSTSKQLDLGTRLLAPQ